MAINYNPTKWENGKTILKASHFEKIEKGITDIINYNNSIYIDEDIRKENEIRREEEHNKKLEEINSAVKDMQADYDSLEKIIIDENASANLQNQINDVNSQLAHNEKYKSGTISVKEIGALCDGVTDETEILRRAHDLLPAEGGKIIINNGKLVVTSKIEFTKTITIEGIYNNFLNSNNSSCILLKNNAELIFKGSRSCVKNLYIDGERGVTKDNGLTFLCSRPVVDNVTVMNQGGYGVSIGDDITNNINVNSWYINNITIRQCGNGLFIGDKNSTSSNANAGCCVKIDASYNTGAGIVLKNCFDNNFLSSHIEMNGSNGVQLINSSGNTFLKPYLEGNDFIADETSIKNNVIGHRRDGNFFTFANEENYYDQSVLSKGIYYLRSLFRVYKLHIANKDVSGVWEVIQKEGNRDLSINFINSSANAKINVIHSNENSTVDLNVQRLSFNNSRIGINNIGYFIGTLNFGTIEAKKSRSIQTPYDGSVTGYCLVKSNVQLANGVIYNGHFNDNGNLTITIFNGSEESISVNSSFSVIIFNATHN